jgi:hypothetical protein
MSFKTDQLLESLPDAYAGADRSSLVHRLLDAIGAELMVADGAVKRLLKSHWVDYAEGAGLDGLGATLGVQRRRLPTGELEDDESFRRRLKSVVRLFTGGGTIEAVTGAVRSALGLPFHLSLLNLPAPLREDLERLVVLEEFSPTPERLVFEDPVEVDGASEIVIDVDVRSALDARARIAWTFAGSGRALSVERVDGGGVRSKPGFVVAPGRQLVLATTPAGTFSAVVGDADVSNQFTALDGVSPPALPAIPREPSRWHLRAKGSMFDETAFDDDTALDDNPEETFDLPDFSVELAWTRTQPLTFDVFVPYFLAAVVEALVEQHGYTGEIFAFEGLPLEVIQQVVDDARAAGVRGNVHFSLTFIEDHGASELPVRLDGLRRQSEDQRMADGLSIGSLNSATEDQSAGELFALAAEFDIATFDGPFGTV